MNREQLIKQYDDIYDTLIEDKDLMLKVLLHHFGGVEHVWDVIHTHFTSIHDCKDLNDEELEEEISSVVSAFREVVDEIVEKELLDNECNSV